ncbi:MAG: ACT domain-containing protein [Thermoplasmata archaeon]|nr:ACT domain-containing protein [Thermoplasmata archaeon]
MRSKRPDLPTVADLTRLYITDHASLRAGLEEDLINFAALARKIQVDTGARNEEAVTIACRRYQRGLEREAHGLDPVRGIVGGSRLEVHSRAAIVRIRDDLDTLDRLLAVGRSTLATPAWRRLFQLFLGTAGITILCDEGLLAGILPEIPERLRLRVERGLGTLAFRSRPEASEVPGVVAHIADALYRSGINCLETISAHTDSIFVFRDVDLLRAYQVLAELVPPGQAEPGPVVGRVA